jgi:hypothetical protein
MIPVLVRPMLAAERSMVLKDWKKDVAELRSETRTWGAGLQGDEFWILLNYVIDNVSLPTAAVWMACNESEPNIPLAWMAVRHLGILHQHAKPSVHAEPELAAYINRRLVERTGGLESDWNPFLELKNHGHRQA